MDVDRDAHVLSGAERFLVGISPQYWSHTPMSIQTLCSLGLVDGIDCFVIKKNAQTNEYPFCQTTFLPVSRCDLVGVIVNCDRKSNGSCLYLLDDGTGMIDCMDWGNNDMYSLPSLVGEYQQPGSVKADTFQVGERVRILGKIRCVSIGNISVRGRVQFDGGKTWDVRDCIREVHITSITAVATSSHVELNHWLRSCEFLRKLSESHGGMATRGQATSKILNGKDVLGLLGHAITEKAMQRSDFPASNDTIGAWRLFGVGCQCELAYKDSLLYCHCQATREALDPQFIFRDALLRYLLDLESGIPLPRAGSDFQTWSKGHLVFQYKRIVENEALQQIAATMASDKDDRDSSSVLKKQLFMRTFSALRDDGILYLMDHDKDTYLLISLARVLEPYCRIMQDKSGENFEARSMLVAEPPAYMSCVPNVRIQYVKKLIADT